MKHALFLIFLLTTYTFSVQAQKKSSLQLSEIELENILYDQFQISPNGQWLSFVKYDNDSSSNIYIQPIQKKIHQAKPFTQHHSSIIEEYYWSPDHSSIVYITKEKDTYSIGSILINFEYPENTIAFQYANNLIQHPTIYRFSESKPYKVYIGYCPPPSTFENLYTIQLDKGYIQTFISNQLNFKDYLVDHNDQLKFVVAQDNDQQHIISYQNSQAEDTLYTSKPKEIINLIDYQNDLQTLDFTIKNAKTKSLYQLHTLSKKANLYTTEPIVSIKNDIYKSQLLGYTLRSNESYTNWLNPRWDSIQHKLQQKHPNTSIEIISPNAQLGNLVYSIASTQIPKTYFLYDIATDSSTILESTLPVNYEKSKTASPFKQIVFESNDMTSVSKLSYPIDAKVKSFPLVILLDTENFTNQISPHFSVETNYLLDQGYAVLHLLVDTKNNQKVDFTQHLSNITEKIYKSIQKAILKGNIDVKNIFLYSGEEGAYLAYQTLQKYPTLIKGAVFNNAFIQIETKLNSFPEYWANEKNRFMDKMGVTIHTPNYIDSIQKLPANLPFIFIHHRDNKGINIHELNQLKSTSSNQSEIYLTNEKRKDLSFIKAITFFHQLSKKSFILSKGLEIQLEQSFTPYQYTPVDTIRQFNEEKFPPLRGKLRKNEYTYDVTLKWNGEVKKFTQTRNIKLEPERYLINSYQMDHLGIRTEKMYLSEDNMPIYQEIVRDEIKKSFTFTKEKSYIVTNDLNKEIASPKSFLVVGNTFDIVIGNLPLKVGYTFNTYVIDEYSQEFQPYRMEVVGEEKDVYKEVYVIDLKHLHDPNSFIKIKLDKRTRLMTYFIQQIPSQGYMVIEKTLVQ